jgi:hypothetical protein
MGEIFPTNPPRAIGRFSNGRSNMEVRLGTTMSQNEPYGLSSPLSMGIAVKPPCGMKNHHFRIVRRKKPARFETPFHET